MPEFLTRNFSSIVTLLLAFGGFIYGYSELNSKVKELTVRVKTAEDGNANHSTLLQKIASDIEVIKTDISWMRESPLKK
jgi:hypothetical protein